MTTLFYLLAVGTLLGGVGVVVSKNPIHAALSLVASLFFLAGLYLTLGAQLIAVLQVLVYAGAVMMLFVFVISLLNLRDEELGRPRITGAKIIGALSVASVLAAAVKVGGDALLTRTGRVFDVATASPTFGTTATVGRSLYLDQVLPFELTSLLLLVAIIGAVVVAKGKI